MYYIDYMSIMAVINKISIKFGVVKIFCVYNCITD